ncbi:MAG: trigger factor [Butyricicoccaceae bacterium]
MKLTNVEKKENNLVELSVTVEKDEFEAGLQYAYKQIAPRINVQGFRKGKAPRKMIEKLYGVEIFYEDAMNYCYPMAYEAAVREAGIQPIDKPMVDPESLAFEDGEMRFKVTVMVKPELGLKAYKGLEAEKAAAEVTDAEVEAELTKQAQRNARQVSVERAAQAGDSVKFDFEGFVDGVAFEGGKAEGYELQLGSGMFIPGFEEQVAGHEIGEEFEVNVTFPEKYQEPSLAGKPAVFKCKIHEVHEIQLPELDDEFAKDVSEFDTLDEYRADLKAKMQSMAEQSAEKAYEEALMNKLTENLEGEVPEVMVEAELDQIVNEFGYNMQMQGIDFKSYLQMNDMEESSFRNLFRMQAEQRIKVRLALEAVARLEGLEVTDEDLEAEFAEMAKNYNMPLEKVKELLMPVAVKSDLLVQKASEFVKANAKAVKPKKARKTTKKAAKKDAAEEAAAAEETSTEKTEENE